MLGFVADIDNSGGGIHLNVKAILLIGAVLLSAAIYASGFKTLIDPVQETVFVVPRPDFATVAGASAQFGPLSRTVNLTLGAVPVFTQYDGMLIKSYFNDDTILLYAMGTTSIPNIPLGPGEVRLLRMSTGKVIGAGSASVSGSTVQISASTMVAMPVSQIAGELGLERVEAVYVDSETVSTRGYSVVDQLFGSTLWLAQRPNMWESYTVFDGLTTEQAGQRQKYRFNKDPWWKVPAPGAPTSPRPKPGDVDGVGRPDWKSNNDTNLGGDIIVNGWVSDADPNGSAGDAMILAIGHDTNGNGILDLGEVTNIIGKCVFVPGRNVVWYEVIEGGYLINMDNFQDLNGNGVIDPGEQQRHYIYNTVTGILKVFDQNGQLLYSGSPSGYWS